MKPREAGIELDAEFHVDRDGDQTTLTVESRGGSRGAPNERNTQYDDGLRVLLRRLGARNVRITDALVTSSNALRKYPDPAQRRLLDDVRYDVRIADFEPDELRRAFGRAMRKAARDPGLTSSGNNNKRVTFWLAGPGVSDPSELEAYLAADDSNAPSAAGSRTAGHRPSGVPTRRPGAVRPPSAPPRRQGYLADARARKAVEDRAMGAAVAHWTARGFDVEDVSGHRPYDLHCTSTSGGEIRVEVKGTTGSGRTVHLTVGEVDHARDYRGSVALFILHSIELRDGEDGPVASGGIPHVDENWDVGSGVLRATRFDWTAE